MWTKWSALGGFLPFAPFLLPFVPPLNPHPQSFPSFHHHSSFSPSSLTDLPPLFPLCSPLRLSLLSPPLPSLILLILVELQAITFGALQFGAVIFCTVLVCSVGLPLALAVFPVQFVR